MHQVLALIMSAGTPVHLSHKLFYASSKSQKIQAITLNEWNVKPFYEFCRQIKSIAWPSFNSTSDSSFARGWKDKRVFLGKREIYPAPDAYIATRHNLTFCVLTWRSDFPCGAYRQTFSGWKIISGMGNEINSLRNLRSFTFVFAIRIRLFDTGKWTRAKTLLQAQIKLWNFLFAIRVIARVFEISLVALKHDYSLCKR